MAENVKKYDNYGDVKQRLDALVEAVEDENISLDEALDKYDEAVKLAMRASELVEVDMGVTSEPETPEEAPETSEEAPA